MLSEGPYRDLSAEPSGQKPGAGENRPFIWANTIADFSGTKHRTDFEIDGHVAVWAKEGASRRVPERLTPAERAIHTLAGQFKYSTQADEYAACLRETDPDAGKDYYGSAHAMLMNGRQNPHFHPDFNGDYPKASLRVLTVIPFANSRSKDHKGRKHTDGIELSFFKLKGPGDHPDPLIDAKNKQIVGDPLTPQYKVHFPPGHIGMVVFDDGIHEFRGNGLVLSVHPLDVGVVNIGNTYDANTLKWNGKKDLSFVEHITPKPHDFGDHSPGYHSLNGLVAAFKTESLRFLDTITKNHDPKDPAPPHAIKAFRANLRNHLVFDV